MDLKYATLGLISGYLAGYVHDYLQTKNTAGSTAQTNDFNTTLSDEEDNI